MKSSQKKLLFIVLGVLILTVLGYVLLNRTVTTNLEGDKIQVAASFYPLYYFASEIGKEKVNVFNITPSGVEPHDYEPTAQDVAKLQTSRLLLINGAGFEPWAVKLQSDLAQNNVIVVNSTEGLELKEGAEHGHEEQNTPGEEMHEEEAFDPHVWLSPVLAKKQVDTITQGLVKVDQENAAFYQANADALKQRLDELHASYEAGLSVCKKRDFITAHAAFGYLANTYNLNQMPISGLSPEAEPSAAEMVEITQFARANNVEYIFFENLVSPKLSETIANEVGAKTLVLDPIEGISDDISTQEKNYFTVMESNLQNLRTALQCQ